MPMYKGPKVWQYFCRVCKYERDGLLDHDWGIGGYSWNCPRCGPSSGIGAYKVDDDKETRRM